MYPKRTAPDARSYIISTQIGSEYGIRLEKLQSKIRKECGKKSKLFQTIEIAIDLLEKEMTEGDT